MDNLNLSSAFTSLSPADLALNLGVAFILGLSLKFHFEKFSTALSGKAELARILPFLALVVCFI